MLHILRKRSTKYKTNMQIIPSYKYTAYTHARTRNRARARKITISGHRGHAGIAAPQPSGRHFLLCMCLTIYKK